MLDLLGLTEQDRQSFLGIIEAEILERSLYAYLEAAWSSIDPAPFTGGWHLEAIAEHLEAVTSGHIRKLLINISPRSSKTSIVAVAWPTWTWAQSRISPLSGPGVRFLCASYGAKKAMEDGVTARRLIASNWYQERWGSRFQIASDRDNQERYDNTAGGSRISTGVPESLGKGGIIRIIDDPHKTNEVESPVAREAVLRAYKEIWSTRSNDPKAGAEIIVMQRQAENDLSGYVKDQNGDEWTHLCIPARFDRTRICQTALPWRDPRSEDGESFWPARFSQADMAKKEREVGPYAWTGQFQQLPSPRGGGIIQDTWWQPWPPVGQEEAWMKDFTTSKGENVRRLVWPDFDFVMLSVDGAYTDKEENDFCACTVWGVFSDAAKNPKVMLIEAWKERLTLHHFVQRILETARRRDADLVLIEAKASGLSAAQEVRRLAKAGEWQTVTQDVKGDKTARLHAVVPLFVDGVVHAPDRKWAEMVIREVANFPKAEHDDLTDTVSQALNWFRKTGMATLKREVAAEKEHQMTFYGNRKSVTDGYFT